MPHSGRMKMRTRVTSPHPRHMTSPSPDPVNFEYTVKRFFNTYTLQKCPLSLIYLRFWSPCSSWQHLFNHPHVTPLTQAHPHHNRRPLEFGYEYISREFVALFAALLANWLWHGWLSFQTGGLGWLWLWREVAGSPSPTLPFHSNDQTKSLRLSKRQHSSRSAFPLWSSVGSGFRSRSCENFSLLWLTPNIGS